MEETKIAPILNNKNDWPSVQPLAPSNIDSEVNKSINDIGYKLDRILGSY